MPIYFYKEVYEANEAQHKEAIEAMVDKHSIGYVLQLLEQLAYDKAEHLSANWQDKPYAKLWSDIAKRLGNAHVKMSEYCPLTKWKD